MTSTALQQFKVGTLNIQIHPDRESAGEAVAREAAQELTYLAQSADEFGVIFATGASQLRMLDRLTSMPGLPWNKVLGFHMDEYIGMPPDHPASFRHYLRQNLLGKVKMKEFFEIDGTASDIDLLCRQYAAKLQEVSPQLCLLGIGENGHLAFNDPGEADFEDPLDVRTVGLDNACRQQQAAEGWFNSLEDVPEIAITLTMPGIIPGAPPHLVRTRSAEGRNRSTHHGRTHLRKLPRYDSSSPSQCHAPSRFGFRSQSVG